MGWLDKLLGRAAPPPAYVTAEAAQANVEEQVRGLGDALDRMCARGLEEGAPLGIEVTFLTNRRDSAERLAGRLRKLDYAVVVEGAGHLGGLHTVAALTPPMAITHERMVMWVRGMAALGAECDCMLEGWTAGMEAG